MTNPEALLSLAARCEAADDNVDEAWFDTMAREIHELDERRPVNGSVRDYVRSIDCAKTLARGLPYALVVTETEARAVVGGLLFDAPSGSAVSPAGRYAEALALTAASLRALSHGERG